MKQTFLGVLILLFSLTACKDDDDNGGPTGNPTTDPVENTGSVSATINGSSFETQGVSARPLSSGGFYIRATDQAGRQLNFELESFIGNGTYTIATALAGTSAFTDVVNGSPIFFINGVGTFDITNYDAVSNSFDATFVLSYSSSVNSGIIIEATGEFSEVKILTLTEPQEGEVNFFYDRQEFYAEFEATARVTKSRFLWITVTNPGFPDRSIVTKLESAEEPTFIEYTDNGWKGFSNSEIVSWEYNPATSTVSGRVKSLDFGDYEIWFVNIPVAQPEVIDVELGDFIYTNGTDTVIFDEATLFIQPGETFYYDFIAENSEGQSVEYSYTSSGSFNPNEVNLGPGRPILLKFRDQGNNVPNADHPGRFNGISADDLPSNQGFLIFESDNQMASFYAYGFTEIF